MSIGQILSIVILSLILTIVLSITIMYISAYITMVRHHKKQEKKFREIRDRIYKSQEYKDLVRANYFNSINKILNNVDTQSKETKHRYQVTPDFACVFEHELTEEELKYAKEIATQLSNMIKYKEDKDHDRDNRN